MNEHVEMSLEKYEELKTYKDKINKIENLFDNTGNYTGSKKIADKENFITDIADILDIYLESKD